MSSDRRGRRRSETMAPLMVGKLPQPLTPTLEARHIRRPFPGLCPNIGTTGDAPLAWSPAAQRKVRLAGSLLGGTAAATRPARGPSAAPAATCPDKSWDVQHQSCLDTTRDYATVSSKSPCLNLNLGARHFVPQCCLPSVFSSARSPTMAVLVLVWYSLRDMQQRAVEGLHWLQGIWKVGFSNSQSSVHCRETDISVPSSSQVPSSGSQSTSLPRRYSLKAPHTLTAPINTRRLTATPSTQRLVACE